MSFLRSHHTDHLLSDAELVLQFQQTQNLEILGRLYERHMDMLFGVCLKYLTDAEAARDAVMQVFEELVVKLPRHQVDNFRGWVYQVARNHCLMQLRTPRNLKTVEFNADIMQNEPASHLDAVFEKESHLLKLEACMEKLPGDQRNVIHLFYLEKKCYNEIASITGNEWKQVRSAIQNGKRNLKICMEKNEASVTVIKKINLNE